MEINLRFIRFINLGPKIKLHKYVSASNMQLDSQGMLIDGIVGIDVDNEEGKELLEHFSKCAMDPSPPPHKIPYDPQHKHQTYHKGLVNKAEFLTFNYL